MVAYSFKPGFVQPIQLREKRQTIRMPRKHPTRQGQELQLFTGPRMRPTRLGKATCVRSVEVRLDFLSDVVELEDGPIIEGAFLDAFAVRDGFGVASRYAHQITPWRYMAKWWAITHPGQSVFLGNLVDWDDTFEPVRP